MKCGWILPKYGIERNITSFIIPPKESHKGNSFSYEPLTEEYFNLATNEITEFDIDINYPKGQIIYQTAAQPTIIVLKFKTNGRWKKKLYRKCHKWKRIGG